MKSKTMKIVKSASRALDLLEFLADAQQAPTFAEISEALEIPKSSLFQLLGNLLERGYIEQSGQKGRYKIGRRIVDLAGKALAAMPLASLIAPVLRELSDELNETCGFYVEKGDYAEIIAAHNGRQALVFSMKVGDRAPLYAISGGKLFLANRSREWIDGYLKRVRFEKFSTNTIQTPERLLQEVERARDEQLASSHEEFTVGIIGVAAPVLLGDEIVGAINFAIPAARFDDELAANVRQKLRQAAARAATILRQSGWVPEENVEVA